MDETHQAILDWLEKGCRDPKSVRQPPTDTWEDIYADERLEHAIDPNKEYKLPSKGNIPIPIGTYTREEALYPLPGETHEQTLKRIGVRPGSIHDNPESLNAGRLEADVKARLSNPSRLFPVGTQRRGTLLQIVAYSGSDINPLRPSGTYLCSCMAILPTGEMCGRRIAVYYQQLYRGSVYSCGCTPRPLPPDHWIYRDPVRVITPVKPHRYRPPAEDFTGRTFGRLFIMEYMPGVGYRAMCTNCARVELVERRVGLDYNTKLARAGRKTCCGESLEDNGKIGCGYRHK